MDSEYGHGDICRGESPKDADERTAERMAPSQRLNVMKAVTQADQHQRDGRIAKEPERLEDRIGDSDLVCSQAPKVKRVPT